jgi:hypothetical protein
MATYTRTISRIANDAAAAPAWRQAMTQQDRLYYVSAAGPSWTGGTLNATLPSHFGATAENEDYGAGWDVMTGYSSGTLLEDVGGPWGTMVYGTGGHTRLQNQLLGLNLGAHSPAFSWWQQPQYRTSAGNGAELYYSPSEAAALAAGPRGSAAVIPLSENPSAWDRRFPVAFDGWIYPDKMTTGQMGDNVPHGFRYSTTCFVPASVTGGDSMFFACTGPQGPFAQSSKPTPDPDTTPFREWFKPEALLSDGTSRRPPFYFRNTRTGAWTEHKWQPDFARYGYTGQQCGVFRDLKRVYISGDRGGGTAGWWYIDMANGFANLTVSARVEPATSVAPNRYACGAWTDGHPQGRHLVFFPDLLNRAGLVVQDFDNNRQQRLDIGQGLNIPINDERVGMSYDALRNRILVLLQNSDTQALYYYVISLPSNPLDASAYRVSLRNLSLDDAAMSTQLGDTTYFYRKTHLHPTLGVIFVPFGRNRMLGFIPSP